MSDETRYPSVRQVERLYAQIIAMTGDEHGYPSNSNLEYLLDTAKDIGERLENKTGTCQEGCLPTLQYNPLHPLLNGNNRTAYQLVYLSLRLNDMKPVQTDPMPINFYSTSHRAEHPLPTSTDG